MSDAMSHASEAAECFRKAAQQRYGSLSATELLDEIEWARSELSYLERVIRAAEERARELRTALDQLNSVAMARTGR